MVCIFCNIQEEVLGSRYIFMRSAMFGALECVAPSLRHVDEARSKTWAQLSFGSREVTAERERAGISLAL